MMHDISGKGIDLMTNEEPLVIEHLYKSFGERKILDDFSLRLNSQENVVVLGKSGAGKSVLIKCVIGLLVPDEGSIKVYGKSVVGIDKHELDRLRATIGFLFQGNALYDSMSVRENLEFPLRRHWIKITENEINDMILDALENVNLAHTVDMMPAELSGGMQKRIALARTMILNPRIILYDEPTTGLDPVTAREIDVLILKLQEKYHTSSIIISHDMNCVKTTANRIVLLLDGKCYTEGTYRELELSQDLKIKQFFE
ncbi:MAG TPA: ATP-binding cassette domain-containing protein [Mucilaginibacter sp.]|nr:ATP-binding cassette domain-containing protein [Mucilaginibacter sp.]